MHGVVLLAAGFGTRMDNQTNDKILENIGKSNAFRMCLDAFSEFQEISSTIIVFRDLEQKEKLQFETKQANSSIRKGISFVQGGEERADSVRNGLEILPESCEFAHIHDCARPLIRRETVAKVIQEAGKNNPVAVARPATNTIRKRISGFTLLKTETKGMPKPKK